MKNLNYSDTEKSVGKSEIGILAYLFFLTMMVLIMIMMFWKDQEKEPEEKVITETKLQPIVIVVQSEKLDNVGYTTTAIPEKEPEIDGKEYLESCVEAEAGNQGELGKAYVCDVILNRLDWDDYNTIYEVINDPGQFQCVSNGSIHRVEVSEETKWVVQNELKSKTDSDIIFFRTGKYHSGTIPCFKYKDHYFSK